LLGAFIAKTQLLKETSLVKAVESSTPVNRKKSIEQNKKAIHQGIEYIEDTKD